MNKIATEITPPLKEGDRLTRDEFERRWEAMPDLKRAELINGVVHMPSPTRLDHAEPHSHVTGWLVWYAAATPGVRTSNAPSVRVDDDNEPQPDACLFIRSECGGQAVEDKQKYLQGAPELLVEVSVTSVRRDLKEKLALYQSQGAKEYIIWRVEHEALDWFILRGEKYEPLPVIDGIAKSEAFPGLWLNVPALLAGDLAAVLATAQRGIASPEHAAFVARLQRQGGGE